MSRIRFAPRAAAALALLLLAHAPAAAQATRTWVSGVGDDANPCSRTAPCKTFAGAISKTAASGEIDALDPGGFGAVTITKSITIDGNGTLASILGASTNGVIVNAGANDVVTLRNLTINGAGSGLNGVRFLAGGALHIENCVIANFAQAGVSFEPAGASRLFIKDTVLRNNRGAGTGGGVLLKPGAGGSAEATLDGVRMEGNLFAIRAEDRAAATVRNSVAAGNINVGFVAASVAGTALMNLEGCLASGHGAANAAGVRAVGAQATVRISNVTVVNNSVGLSPTTGGAIVSFSNNRVVGNTTDGAPTATVTPK
jgi:hypothetical protein